MVQINFALKEVNCKIVYYGPGLSGKTTNLEVVHGKAPSSNVGELTSIATEGDRTLFFDFLPLNLGPVAGMTTKFQIYTVPGQIYYNSTRKLVLQGADGIVFVADSRKGKMDENLESLANLEENLQEYGMDINSLPLVLQYNKRDLPDIYTVEEMEEKLNRFGAPYFEAVAVTGEGVFPTMKKLSQMVLESLNRNQGSTAIRTPKKKKAQPVPVAAGAPAASAAPPRTGAPPRPAAPKGAGTRSVRSRPQAPAATSPSQASTTRKKTMGPRVVKEPVTTSPGVKPIERKSPAGAEPVVRKRSGMAPQPAAKPPSKGRAGKIVAIILVLLAGAGAALYFSGVLDQFLKS